MNTVTISCQYFAKPGGKKEHKYSKNINITEETLDKLNEYNGSIGIEATDNIGLKAAINSCWSESLMESIQTKQTNSTETENSIEYYEGVGLIIRKMAYTYRIDGKIMEKIETEIITTYLCNNKYFSPAELRNEAKQDMYNRFGIEQDEIIVNLKLPEKKNKEPFVIWKRAHKDERRPSNAIYAGTGTKGDGECYVARFNYVPGKVNVNTNNKSILNHFWCPGFLHSRDYGEVLTTNCNYRWVFIKENDKIPHNALGPYKINTYELYDWNIKFAWVAKRINGEPGRLTCSKKYYDYIQKSKMNVNKYDYVDDHDDDDVSKMKSITHWAATRINGEQGRLTYSKKYYAYLQNSNNNINKHDYVYEDIPKMKSIKAHTSVFSEKSGYILVIDEMNMLNGYHCLNDLTNET